MKAFNDPSFLENITGLTKMKEEAEEIEWEAGDVDDF